MDATVAVAIGLVSGALGGMLGVGGGILMVPGMVLLLDLDQRAAQGVSLGVIVLMGVVGSFVQYRQATLRLPIVLCAAPAAVLFGLLGGYLAGKVEMETLTRLFGGVLLLSGLRMLWATRKSPFVWTRKREGKGDGVRA